jgi:hypothetical protein
MAPSGAARRKSRDLSGTLWKRGDSHTLPKLAVGQKYCWKPHTKLHVMKDATNASSIAVVSLWGKGKVSTNGKCYTHATIMWFSAHKGEFRDVESKKFKTKTKGVIKKGNCTLAKMFLDYIKENYTKNYDGFMDTLAMVCYCSPIDPSKDAASYNAVERWRLAWKWLRHFTHGQLMELGSKGLMTCSCDDWLHYVFCKHTYLFASERKIISGFPKLRDPNNEGPSGLKFGHPQTIQRGRSAALTRDRAMPVIQ